MEEKWSRLGTLLTQLIELYTAMLDLGRKKREVLIQSKVQELDEITRSEEALVRQVAKLEQTRGELLAELAAVLSLTGEVSLQRLYAHAGPLRSKKLAEQGEKLTGLLEELKGLNGQNMQLIQQAMQFIDYNVNLLTRAVSDPTYGPKASAPGGKGTNRSWIDAKI